MMDRIIFDNTLKSYILFLISLASAGIISFAYHFLTLRFKKASRISRGIYMILSAIGFRIGVGFFNQKTVLFSRMDTLARMFFVISVSWLIAEIIIVTLDKYFRSGKYSDDKFMAKQVFDLIRKSVIVIITLVSGTMILTMLGFNVLSLVTGLGIGGIAVALAAQDFLSNIIGGITIFTSKILQVGDYAAIGNYEGTITYIGLRTTKMLMLNGKKIIMPNNEIMKSTIINHSFGSRTLLNYVIGVTYDTSVEKLKSAIDIIKKILEEDDRIPDKKTLSAGFYRFDTYSLNIYVGFYVKKTGDIGSIKEDFHFKVKEAFDAEGIEIAFPTSTVFINNQDIRS